jgi:hypothetical protein
MTVRRISKTKAWNVEVELKRGTSSQLTSRKDSISHDLIGTSAQPQSNKHSSTTPVGGKYNSGASH